MHLLASKVTRVYSIGESIFPKVSDLMNPHSEMSTYFNTILIRYRPITDYKQYDCKIYKSEDLDDLEYN